ncbi:hypothetical protein CK203_015021 [Vitis vinifera]|uniref:Reverse transcriptase domain-containing protein n=1 Tax=Vitis vinifera TaxID=29760 RepID=A0A438JD60_VITVI|nr:hypothetical protein CK203_015021 [Vitis vinifera]
MAVDEGTKSMSELQWTRILVKRAEWEVPNSAHIVLGTGCFSLQLWWESAPCQRKRVEQLRLQVKVQDVALDGGKPPMPSDEASAEETIERRWAGGPTDLVGGGRESSPISLDEFGCGLASPYSGPSYGPSALSCGEAQGFVLGASRDASGEADPLVGLTKDSTMLCSSQLMDWGHLTDEAFCEEASRYVDLCFIPLGGQDLSSSSPSSFGRVTLNEGSFGGSASEVNEEEQTPLSIILVDGSNRVLASKGEKPVAGEGARGEFEGLLQDLDGCRWDDNCLARFSKFLASPRRGANDRNKRKVIKALIRSQKVDVVCLQETKIQEMSQGVIHSLGVGRFLGWGAVNARGAAGGVVVFWDKRVLELVGLEVGIFSISCRFKNCEDGFMWFFTGIYGPTLKRGPYTWSGGLNGQSRSRLDRFLISEDWKNHFSGMSQCTLPRPVSDHFPILLDGGGVRRGPIPFRFENMWLKEEGFKELLKELVARFNFSGSYSFVLSEKLKALKVKLKNWNKEVFGKVGVNLRMALDKVSFWMIRRVPKKGGADDLRYYRPISLVGGRQILDAALIAKEAIDSLLKGDEAGVLCKLDLEKAYDHINWDFLMTMMQKMGFGEKWTGWIRWCISTASFSILINGSPTAAGLRGRGGNGIQVSHLLFADDTLVFCEDSQDQMVVLSWLLMWFEAISGLSINLNKSEILPVGRVENVEVLASELGCKVGSLPSTYLGLPLEHLASMSIYLMSLMRMLRVVRLRLDKIQRDFLWGGGCVGEEASSCKVGCGDGRRVKFGRTLGVETFPFVRLFLLCLPLRSLKMHGGGGEFPFVPSRKELIVGMEDRVLWNASKNGIFSVKSLYNTLDSSGAVPFPWRIIWSPCVPTKVGFFAWEASWGKVLTQDQLKRRAGF